MAASTEFSRRLLLTRHDLAINQDALAAAAGVSRPYISRLERGRVQDVPITVVAALAAALGVRPEYLAGWTEDPIGEDRPDSLAEGRIVYQVDSPSQYRLIHEFIDLFSELPREDQDVLLQLANRLHSHQKTRIIE